ncbi:MAG: urea transport system substrate-binding protein, partial [Solirubrobacteraceae bacterium]|nr:urea transport system substrate-binding protein [Solirubrobacteraceae bacterium]
MRRLGTTRWVIAGLAVAAMTVAGCGSSDSASSGGGSSASKASAEPGVSGDKIKVGILHSLSGTMAISEVSVRDAELLAIEEINKAGGVLGKKLVPVVEDGAS